MEMGGGGHGGITYKGVTIHQPKRWHSVTGKGMCAMMWSVYSPLSFSILLFKSHLVDLFLLYLSFNSILISMNSIHDCILQFSCILSSNFDPSVANE